VAEFVGDSNVMAGTVADTTSRRVTLPALGVTVTVARTLAPGPVEILIRPERVSLVAGASAAEPDMVTVTMKVAAVTHFGDSTLVTGQAGSQPLRVRVPARHAAQARAGDEVIVGWRAGDVHVIPPPGGTHSE
jgi:putative spermidine/putrescine transport system ATP-binding protein